MNLSRQIALFKQTMQTDGNSNFQYLLKLLMMLICFMLMLFVNLGSSGAKGLEMLAIISSTNLFFVTIATISLFCTCVTEEKEHNTIGVLLMTGISPFGFLVGKTLSRLYIVIQLILLQIPMIVVARTLGGLSMDQIVAHLVYFIVVIIAMSQLAMLFSIISSKSSTSIFFTCIGMAFLCSLPCNNNSTFFSYYFKVFETNFDEAIISQPVLMLAGFSFCAFVSGLMIFNKFTHGEGAGVNADLSPVSSKRRARFGDSPIFQKDFRYMAGGKRALVIRVTMLAFSLFLLDLYRIREYVFGGVLAWFYIECFYYSQVMIKQEKSYKTLSSLGMIPVRSKDILNQKYKAFAISVMPSLVAFLVCSFMVSREMLPNLVTFSLFVLSIFSHFLISLLCSIVYDRMALVVAVLYILLYSMAFFLCPMGWLLFLPSLVILSVNVYEKFALEISRG